MQVLIVNAYPEAKSFGGALRDAIAHHLAQEGHSVTHSDLYDSKFKPVDYPDDYAPRLDPTYFNMEAEQRNAYITGTLPAQVKAEQDKIIAADAVIFLCPVYWASAPAMLKGWFERVFTPVFAYDAKQKFENGPMKGKKAMFVTSSGGLMGAANQNGAQKVAEKIFEPLCGAPLKYCGFKVLPTRAVIAPSKLTAPEKEKLVETISKRISRDLTKVTFTPKRKPGVLIHLNGRPGVGKKTIAQAYAAKYGAILVDNHTLLNPGAAVSGRQTEGYYRVGKAVRAAVYAEIEEGLKQGKSYILTNALTNEVPHHTEMFEEIRDLAARSGARFAPFTLFCDRDENLRRVQSPSRAADRKLTDPNKLKELFNKFTMLTEVGEDWIEVTRKSPDVVARMLHDYSRTIKPSSPSTPVPPKR